MGRPARMIHYIFSYPKSDWGKTASNDSIPTKGPNAGKAPKGSGDSPKSLELYPLGYRKKMQPRRRQTLTRTAQPVHYLRPWMKIKTYAQRLILHHSLRQALRLSSSVGFTRRTSSRAIPPVRLRLGQCFLIGQTVRQRRITLANMGTRRLMLGRQRRIMTPRIVLFQFVPKHQ